MLPILLVVVFTQGIRFSLSRALVVALLTTAGLVAVILWVPRPDFGRAERFRQAAWWSWMLLSSAIAAGVLSHAAALAQRKRADAEAAAAAEHRRLDEERALRQRLEAIDEARKDFLHALSHDFRTPIASSEALAQALVWEQHPLSETEKAEAIALIQSHARQLGAMLGEVREVAVTESLGTGQRVEIADVFMPELIQSAAVAAWPPRRPGGVECRSGPEGPPQRRPQALPDPDQPAGECPQALAGRERIEVRLARRKEMVEWPSSTGGRASRPSGREGPPEGRQLRPAPFHGLGMWIVAQFTAALDGELEVDARSGGGLIVRAGSRPGSPPTAMSQAPTAPSPARTPRWRRIRPNGQLPRRPEGRRL